MIFRGPYPDVAIPEVSLTDFIFATTGNFKDKPALVDEASGRSMTYAEFEDAVRRVAASLARKGFEKGDVFAIFSTNCIEYAVTFHAVAMLGGIVSPLNPLYTAEEATFQLRDAGAKFLVTVPLCIEKAGAGAKAAGIEELFVFGDSEGATAFNSLLESDGEVPSVTIDPKNDLVALPYSSGTTGLPKGVMLTHYNIVANMCQMDGLDYFERDDILLCVLPLFHIYGLVVVLNMTPAPHHGFRVGVPEDGSWKEIFNSDDKKYWGSGMLNDKAVKAEKEHWHGREHSVQIDLPPLGATVLKRVK